MKAHNHSDQLDSKLASVNQQAMRNIVHQLPDDTLSMAWRSSLNERLLAEAAAQKPRFRFRFVAMPAAGLAMTAALAAVVFFHAPTHPATGDSTASISGGAALEQGLFDTYRQESVSREIIGSGPDLAADAARPSIPDIAAATYSSEVDPDSL